MLQAEWAEAVLQDKTAPTTKHYLAPNITCAEAEEPYIRLRSLCRGQCGPVAVRYSEGSPGSGGISECPCL